MKDLKPVSQQTPEDAARKARENVQKMLSEQPRFVGIESVNQTLYALDEQGQVWKYTSATEEWERLGNKRSDRVAYGDWPRG